MGIMKSVLTILPTASGGESDINPVCCPVTMTGKAYGIDQRFHQIRT